MIQILTTIVLILIMVIFVNAVSVIVYLLWNPVAEIYGLPKLLFMNALLFSVAFLAIGMYI